MTHSIFLYILIMAVVTYLIRMLPMVLLKKEITSPFIRSFLYYVPFACLAAMTFPAILHASDDMRASILGFAVALVLSYRKKSLLTVAACACVVVFAAELFLV